MNEGWEMCECKWPFVSRSVTVEHASWQTEGLWQNLAIRVDKFVSKYLFGVTAGASC